MIWLNLSWISEKLTSKNYDILEANKIHYHQNESETFSFISWDATIDGTIEHYVGVLSTFPNQQTFHDKIYCLLFCLKYLRQSHIKMSLRCTRRIFHCPFSVQILQKSWACKKLNAKLKMRYSTLEKWRFNNVLL